MSWAASAISTGLGWNRRGRAGLAGGAETGRAGRLATGDAGRLATGRERLDRALYDVTRAECVETREAPLGVEGTIKPREINFAPCLQGLPVPSFRNVKSGQSQETCPVKSLWMQYPLFVESFRIS
jgi:hypothetical protein